MWKIGGSPTPSRTLAVLGLALGTGITGAAGVVVAVPTAVPALAAAASASSASSADSLSEQLAAVQRQVAGKEASLVGLERSIADREARIADAEARRDAAVAALSARVGAAYRYGVSDVTMAAVLGGTDPLELADGLMKLDRVQDVDISTEEGTSKLAEQLAQERAELEGLLAEQRRQVADLLKQKSALADALAAARAAEAATAPDAGRAGGGSPGSGGAAPGAARVTGGMACPVSTPYHFIDSFGAPRSGGRSHKGVDIFAPHGSPLHAVESGVVERSRTNSLGGLYIWLVGDSGNEYYYAHNSANLVPAGTRVAAGQVIARLGNSGNAAGHPSHLHFEVHPGGGAAINPTPFARRLCP